MGRERTGSAVVERVRVAPASYESLMEQVRAARAEIQRLQLEVDLQHVSAMSTGDTATAARMRPTVRELERMAANLSALETEAREARFSEEQQRFHRIAEQLAQATLRASTSLRRAVWTLVLLGVLAAGTGVALGLDLVPLDDWALPR